MTASLADGSISSRRKVLPTSASNQSASSPNRHISSGFVFSSLYDYICNFLEVEITLKPIVQYWFCEWPAQVFPVSPWYLLMWYGYTFQGKLHWLTALTNLTFFLFWPWALLLRCNLLYKCSEEPTETNRHIRQTRDINKDGRSKWTVRNYIAPENIT